MRFQLGETIMRMLWNAFLVASLSTSSLMYVLVAQAQTISRPQMSIALKNGETTEVSDVYYIGANCRTLTTATPEVEVLDGPPGVSAAIKPAMVVPRGYGCAKPV